MAEDKQDSSLIDGIALILNGVRAEDEQLVRVRHALMMLIDVHRDLSTDDKTIAQLKKRIFDIESGKKPRFKLQQQEVV